MLAVFLVAAAVWTGAIVFQSAVVAPAVFRTLDEGAARAFLRALFPSFYRFGLACGSVMLLSLGLIALLSGMTPALGALALIAATMLILEVVSLRLVPAINAARDAGESGAARFSRLHRVSVMLTVIVLVLGVVAIATIGLNAGFPAST